MPGLHAELAPSAAKRWIRCAASIRMIRELYAKGGKASDSIFAREGTAAHEVGQLCLEQNRDTVELIGRKFNTDIECNEEMAEHVQFYVDLCREEAKGHELFFIEGKIDLDALKPPVPVWGTSDFFVFKRAVKTLTVIDLKYGQGIVVDAEENEQGRCYATGALLLLTDPAKGYNILASEIEWVEVVICQPRAFHRDGPVRRERISVAELGTWYRKVLEPAITATLDPNAPFGPGDHCQLCDAGGICKARQDWNLDRAQLAFADPPALIQEPPAPETLGIDDLLRVHEARPLFEAWLKAADAQLFRMMSAGIDAAGYKLGATYGRRRWKSVIDEEGIAATLTGLFSVTDMQIYQPRKLRSPAQVEKFLPKNERASLKALWEKPLTGAVIVPAGDERPAIANIAEAIFEAPDNPEGE